MTDPNFVLLYVDNPARSAAFYSDLLGKQPVESSANFVLFALASGAMFGLWSRREVEPKLEANGVSGGELAFAVEDKKAVAAAHQDWTKRGIKIVQAPTTMDFGFTFTALDPDGHRLRVFAPGGP